MVSGDSLIQVGKILKSIRLKGEMLCTFEPFFIPDDFEPKVLFIGEKNPLPFFISEIGIDSEHICIIDFEEIDSKESADKYSGRKLWMRENAPELKQLNENQAIEPDHDYLTYTVIDKTQGSLGKIIAIYEAQGNIVAECEKDGIEIMIPLHRDLIEKVDEENKTIYTDFPPGLSDL